MRFGVLAGNRHINSRIYEMLDQIDSADVSAFVRKFRSERNEQRFHTYRELVVGAHLRSHGAAVRYERSVLGKTPDWTLPDPQDGVLEIIDVVALHQRRETESEMLWSLGAGKIWSGWVTIPADHLFRKIEHKANAYASLSAALQRPYTLFLFGEFTACVEPQEIGEVLHVRHGGLFASHPELAGVAYFVESYGIYRYTYFKNSAATYESHTLAALAQE